MHISQSITLLVISIGAFVVPLLSGRLGIPAAVGEIAFGMLAGPFALHIVTPGPSFDFLSDFGFVFLLFLAGLDLDFKRLERRGLRSWFVCLALPMLVFGTGFLVVRWRHWPVFLALVLAAMSIGILSVTLREAGLAQSDAGQTLILIGSAGEFLTILVLTYYNISHRFGFGLPFWREVAKLALIFVLAYFVLKILRLLVWWYPHQFSRLVEKDDPSEIGVRACLALMIAFVAISAMLSVESILGAFLAGALFSSVFREKGILEVKLASLGQGFFIPIFFIHVGVSFDLAAIHGVAILLLIGQLMALALLTKTIPGLLLIAERMQVRILFGSTLILSSSLTILVAIATVGKRLGVIDDQMQAAIILLAVISSLLYPTLFKWIVAKPVSLRQS